MRKEVIEVYQQMKRLLSKEIVLTGSNVLRHYGLLPESDATISDIDLVIERPTEQDLQLLSAMEIASWSEKHDGYNDGRLYRVLVQGIKVDVFIVDKFESTLMMGEIPVYLPGNILRAKAGYARAKDFQQIVNVLNHISEFGLSNVVRR